MSNPFEFTRDQNFWKHLREDGQFLWWKWKGYRLPFSDVDVDRPLDLTRVGRVGIDPAFDPHLADKPLGLPGDYSRWRASWNNAGGQPLQAGDPTRTIDVHVLKATWVNGQPVHYPGNVEYSVQVPAPKAGYLWVQGNPQPVKHLAGWNDQHARILNPDGSSTEMIGATPKHEGGRTVSVECRGLGRYAPNGDLVDSRDRHVTVWKEETAQDGPASRVSPLMLGRAEQPHRLTVSVPGKDAPDTMHEIGLWVALPHDAVPWADLTPDAHRVASMLVNHGAMTSDHGQNGSVIDVAGADWAGVDWGEWKPKFGDFRRVAAAA